MSEEYMYTQGDILTSPYEFQKVLQLKIVKELNEHGRLYISGIIGDENLDKYVEETGSNQGINISVKDNNQNIITLFKGIVTKVGIKAINNVRILEVEALSETLLMDINKVNGSYQDEKFTYGDVFKKRNNEHENVVMVDSSDITANTPIDDFIVQYKETDWEFLKRLASHFNLALVPECRLGGIKYSVGSAGEAAVYDIDEFNYTIEKGLKEYNLKSSNEDYDLDDINLISYEVTTNKIMNLYNEVTFKGRKLLVYKCETELKGGVILNKYILRDENGMKVRKLYNDKVVGISLTGRVLDVKKDKVKISLEIDGSPTERDGAKWFEFATIFSSPYGTGWYCMPEIEDVIRLYFPDNEEKHSYVVSSAHYSYTDVSKRSDPSVKSISTKYGKEIVMSPGSVEIIGNGNLLMRLTDDGGIEVKSNKKIILDARDDIEINGGSNIEIKGNRGIKLTQSNASMIIKNDITMSGGKVNVQD